MYCLATLGVHASGARRSALQKAHNLDSVNFHTCTTIGSGAPITPSPNADSPHSVAALSSDTTLAQRTNFPCRPNSTSLAHGEILPRTSRRGNTLEHSVHLRVDFLDSRHKPQVRVGRRRLEWLMSEWLESEGKKPHAGVEVGASPRSTVLGGIWRSPSVYQ